jgi:tRNA(fMet)-specific endonuclease VapC
MKYLLDTNTCIRYINGCAPKIYEHMQAIADLEMAICTITMGEMFTGSYKSKQPQVSRLKQDAFFVRFKILDFSQTWADVFGQIRARLELAGTPIGPYDMQIAATALAYNLTLVTHNLKEFKRIPGLVLEDWEI